MLFEVTEGTFKVEKERWAKWELKLPYQSKKLVDKVNKPKVNILIIVQFLRQEKTYPEVAKHDHIIVFEMWKGLGMNMKGIFIF